MEWLATLELASNNCVPLLDLPKGCSIQLAGDQFDLVAVMANESTSLSIDWNDFVS